MLTRVERFAELIETGDDPAGFAAIRAAETTGRPLGAAEFVADLERRLGRPLARRAPGRKPSQTAPQQAALF